MYSLRFVVIVVYLIFLSSCAQKQESDQLNDSKTTEIAQLETTTLGSVGDNDSNDLNERQNTGLDEATEQSSSRDELSLNIDGLNSLLQREFAQADRNGDGYLELNELPPQKFDWIPGIRMFKHPEFFDPQFSTVHLEARQRGLERAGNSERALRYVNVALKERYDFEFDTADVDRDNELSRDEYHKRNSRLHDRDKRRRFPQLDTNQDGLVDYKEFAVEVDRWRMRDQNQDGFVSRVEQRATQYVR